jgi:hypothetical protein
MVEKQPPEIVDREQSEEVTSEQAVSKDELTYWRYIGKEFGMTIQPWLSSSILGYSCQCKSQEDRDPEVRDIVKYLNNSRVEPQLWTMGRFQSEVLFYFIVRFTAGDGGKRQRAKPNPCRFI